MHRKSRIFVAGHQGMVGRAVTRELQEQGFEQLILRSRSELDLRNQTQVLAMLRDERPDFIVVAAAKVGGILANNTLRADFITENLGIALNLIYGAHQADVSRLLFLGSSCIYPRDCRQPMAEEDLMTGPLEPTNSPYAMAKLAGISLCHAYRAQHGRRYSSVMPTNLFGPHDNFDLSSSHVLPALLRKAHEAKMSHASTLEVWGSGVPRREFLFVDDLAKACVFLMHHDDPPSLVNVGYGEDVSIRDLAELVARVVGFKGALRFDASKPDGMPRKLLNSHRIRELGWRPSVNLEDGIRRTYDFFLSSVQG